MRWTNFCEVSTGHFIQSFTSLDLGWICDVFLLVNRDKILDLIKFDKRSVITFCNLECDILTLRIKCFWKIIGDESPGVVLFWEVEPRKIAVSLVVLWDA